MNSQNQNKRQPVLLLKNLNYRIGKKSDDSCTVVMSQLALYPQARIAVIGPSGSGKSTLLEILALARNPGGSVESFSMNISQGNEVDIQDAWKRHSGILRQIRASHISYTPQRGGYVPCLSLRNNLKLRTALASQAVRSTELLSSMLAEFGLSEEKLDRRLDSLSAGERQRGVMVQNLLLRPAVMIADEPTSALHPMQALSVLKKMVIHARQVKSALVIATHDIALVRQLGFHIVEGQSIRGGGGNITMFKSLSAKK